MDIEIRQDLDWEGIRAEYVAGGVSYRELVARHGVRMGILKRRAKAEQWVACRRRAAQARKGESPTDGDGDAEHTSSEQALEPMLGGGDAEFASSEQASEREPGGGDAEYASSEQASERRSGGGDAEHASSEQVSERMIDGGDAKHASTGQELEKTPVGGEADDPSSEHPSDSSPAMASGDRDDPSTGHPSERVAVASSAPIAAYALPPCPSPTEESEEMDEAAVAAGIRRKALRILDRMFDAWEGVGGTEQRFVADGVTYVRKLRDMTAILKELTVGAAREDRGDVEDLSPLAALLRPEEADGEDEDDEE